MYIYIYIYIYHTSCAQVHELPQSHCGDNRGEHIVFMITYIYIYNIYTYIQIYNIYIYVCM